MALYYIDIDREPNNSWTPGDGTIANPAPLSDVLNFGPLVGNDGVRCTGGTTRALTDPLLPPPATIIRFDGWDGNTDGGTWVCGQYWTGVDVWRLWNATDNPWDWTAVGQNLYITSYMTRVAIRQQTIATQLPFGAGWFRWRTCMFQYNGTMDVNAQGVAGTYFYYDGCTFDCRELRVGTGLSLIHI